MIKRVCYAGIAITTTEIKGWNCNSNPKFIPESAPYIFKFSYSLTILTQTSSPKFAAPLCTQISFPFASNGNISACLFFLFFKDLAEIFRDCIPCGNYDSCKIDT